MKKVIYLMMLLSFLFVSAEAMAQQAARAGTDTDLVFRQGTRELGLSGLIDFEGAEGGVDVNLSATYGYFMNRFLEVGGFFRYSRLRDGDVNTYDIGAFAEYHLLGTNVAFFTNVVPYLGLSVGLGLLDSDISEDQNAVIFSPRVGLKWFFRNYVAIDTNLFVNIATEDIYYNDGSFDPYDIGIAIGLRVYF
jgi:hypothetical protein